MRAILASVLILCSAWVNATDTLTINVDPAKPQFVVTLPANPTTGYQWKATTYDKKILRMMSRHYVARKTGLIGSGGKMVFTFALIKGKSYPEFTQMEFMYARPWEANAGTSKKVTVNFQNK